LSGAPLVEAIIVICDAPSGVFEDVLTVSVTGTGLPLTRLTAFEGWN
jgi:hypothetical protein